MTLSESSPVLQMHFVEKLMKEVLYRTNRSLSIYPSFYKIPLAYGYIECVYYMSIFAIFSTLGI